jgi:predicted MFS family arabinose efflux permease
MLAPLLITLAGAVLAVASRPWLLMAAAVLGTLSPNGQEGGPFSPLEQAALPQAVRPEIRTRAFAWYNMCAYLPAALGALSAGAWLGVARRLGQDEMHAYRGMLWLYAGLGIALSVLYARLSPQVEAPARREERERERGSEGEKGDTAIEPSSQSLPHSRSPSLPRSRVGLHRSRGIVLQLAGLQAVDALAGGLVVQSLMAYWLHLRFGVGPEALGPLFFGTNLLAAVSLLAAARVAERFGLLNTMVFSHLPSNVLLMLVPLMPSLPLAAIVLLTRSLLSQMDVPTRQAYTMALVAPDERSAAAGLTTSARALAQAVAPMLTGVALARAATGLPFFLGGGLKILYDLAVYFAFRRVPLPAE